MSTQCDDPSGVLYCTVAPTGFPISRTEAKAHLRVENTAEDTLIDLAIASAVEYLDGADGILSRALLTQTWRLSLPEFPEDDEGIVLPLPPVQSIASVQYIDSDGATQTLSSGSYRLVRGHFTSRVMPAFGESWPTARSDTPDAVQVDFVAGYGAASAVPAAIKQALLLLVGHFYETRTATVDRSRAALPFGVDALIARYMAPMV